MENNSCVQHHDLFIKKAKSLFPKLLETNVFPQNDQGDALNTEIFAKTRPGDPMGSGESLLLDFGNHQVGYLTLKMGYTGSHPDAPVWLRVRFAERLQELKEDVNLYHGWISKGWIQSEELHIDVLPAEVTMPRRYAFRYVLIEVLDVSSRFRLKVEEASCRAVSSADDSRLKPFIGSAEDQKLDQIACRTLHECMQTVFEDGPKRDRRLWIGDLRLQALVNYETYRQNDMVRACLYLFAGSTLPDGRVSACIFLEPEIEADDTAMFDYSLFFIAALRDYYNATGDLETVCDLYPTAQKQWMLAQGYFDETGVIRDSDEVGWCFVDWDLGLNKQASAQGIYLYCTRALMELTKALDEDMGQEKEPVRARMDSLSGAKVPEYDLRREAEKLEQDLVRKMRAAKICFYDKKRDVFVSGASRQISYASQAWMVLGGAADGSVLSAVERIPEAHMMVTPYMYHHFIEALMQVGEKEKALNVMRKYWGGMASEGADTFWELYNPENPQESPYGGSIVNSYCHAWSCGPAYFLRKYTGTKGNG